MNERKILTELIRPARMAYEVDRLMITHGVEYSAFFKICGDIADAIFHFIDEHADPFETSITYTAVFSDDLSEEQRIDMLINEYRKNHPPISERMT